MRYILNMNLEYGGEIVETSVEYDEKPFVPSIGDTVLFITDGSWLGVVRDRRFQYGPDDQLCAVSLHCESPD